MKLSQTEAMWSFLCNQDWTPRFAAVWLYECVFEGSHSHEKYERGNFESKVHGTIRLACLLRRREGWKRMWWSIFDMWQDSNFPALFRSCWRTSAFELFTALDFRQLRLAKLRSSQRRELLLMQQRLRSQRSRSQVSMARWRGVQNHGWPVRTKKKVNCTVVDGCK